MVKAPRQGFNITLWFVAVSTGVVVLTQVVLGIVTTAFLSDRFLQREGRMSQEFLENIVRAENSGSRLFDAEIGRADLQSFAKYILRMPGFLRANIYSPDGTVWWSSDETMIGQGDGDNEELQEAFAGKLVTELGDLTHDTKDEHRSLPVSADRTFIESYIPVHDASGRLITVVEFYKSAAALNDLVGDARNIIWLVTAAGAILLFATFLGIVRRGTNFIRRQQSEIANMEALAMVGEMAGAVAHSLRNPLASLRSTAELAKIEHNGAIAEAMDDMILEVDRLDQHVRDLLNYTRLETPSAQQVDPKELVQGILAKEAQRLARLGVTTHLIDARKAGETIHADPALLRQAIAGILANSVEAMPGGGKIEVRIESVADGRRVSIAFTDTGRGIPAALLARVCEPFFTTKPRGLGLGLALTKRIVARCTGTLAIQSMEGRGTLVVLDFATKG